jgi:hypothetical protein
MLCDLCTEVVAPWVGVPVDPYILALEGIHGELFIQNMDDFYF